MFSKQALSRQVLALLMLVALLSLGPEWAKAGGFQPQPGAKWHNWFCLGNQVCAVGDFDGNGQDDIAAFVQDSNPDRQGDVYVAVSTGSGFAPDPGQKWHDWFCLGGETCAIGDFNNDGKDDLITFVGNARSGDGKGDVLVALSNGITFGASQKWHDWFCLGGERCLVGNFDGVGGDDIITFVRDSNANRRGDVYVATSTGSGFSPNPGQKWHDFFCIGQEICAVGDVNGDGMDDIVTFVRDSNPSKRGNVYVALSNGHRFMPDPGQKWHDLFCLGGEICALDDVNGDGLDDLVAFSRNTRAGHGRGDVHVALSTGSGFGPSTVWHDWFCLGREVCATGDFDGDGQADLAAFVRSSKTNQREGDVYVAFSDAPSRPEPDTMAADFGYAGMTTDSGALANQPRPLLVVLMQASGGRGVGPFRYPPAYYDRLLFGPSYPNVADYYLEASYGQFTWTKAAILGPITDPNPTSTLTSRRASVKQLAANLSFNFAAYDINADGSVTTDELGILIIDNYSSVNGQTESTPNCFRPTGVSVNVCSEVSAIGEGTSLTLAAHELSHLLGSQDIYGSLNLSSNLSLLSGSGGLDNLSSFHPDPWHKMRLGWIKPRIYRLTDAGSCTYLEAAQNGGAYQTENRRPIFLYNPAQGPNQYLALEYRWPANGTYDANAADQGLAVWFINTNPDNTLPQIAGLAIDWGPDQTLQTNPAPGSDDVLGIRRITAGPDRILQTRPAVGSNDFIVPDAPNFVLGAPKALRGLSSLWKPTNGLIQLRMQLNRWLDPSGNNLNLRVGPMNASSPIIEVEWGFGKPFTAHIDRLRGPSSGAPGTTLTLDGLFGVANGGRVASLSNETGNFDLEVVSWTCSTITVRVPQGTSPGSYKLRVYTDAGHTVGSNGVLFTVENPAAITIPPSGANFSIPTDGTSFSFPADAFPEAVSFHYTPVPANSDSIPPAGNLIGTGRFFTVEALYGSSGQPAQPAHPYAISVPYNEGAPEDGLALYYWDDEQSQWVKEPSSMVNAAESLITATPNHFSLWAVLGQAPAGKHKIFLPIVLGR